MSHVSRAPPPPRGDLQISLENVMLSLVRTSNSPSLTFVILVTTQLTL